MTLLIPSLEVFQPSGAAALQEQDGKMSFFPNQRWAKQGFANIHHKNAPRQRRGACGLFLPFPYTFPGSLIHLPPLSDAGDEDVCPCRQVRVWV